MCGFYLAYSLEDALPDSAKKHVSLKHRGPDSNKSYQDASLFIHFYRLKILGGEAGTQPMVSESQRYVMAFNGEIYNYKELAEVLGRSDLGEAGDSRVLLEWFEKKGMNAVDELNGMFAISLYDRKEKKLHLVRDRFGVKPLNYFLKGKCLFASSEIKAFFEQTDPQLDLEAVREYLEFGAYPHSEKTFYQSIKQVVPGTVLSISSRGLEERRYFDIVKEIKGWQEKRPTTDEFESLLADSIRLRLRSDIPIDLHYSGGTDSTAILLKTKEVWGWDYPLETFTHAYSEESTDESQLAKSYCERLGIKNHRIVLSPDEVPELAQKLQFFEDEPFGGIPMLAYFKSNLLQKQAGFTVALEGQGGDEALGGYPTHLLFAAYDLFQSGQNPDLLDRLLLRLGKDSNELQRHAEKMVEAGFASHSDLTDLRPGRGGREKTLGQWLLTLQLYDLLQNKLPRVLRFEDRASMAASREIRFPFLDYRVMGCGMALQLSQKFDEGRSKAPLLKIIEKYLLDFSSEKRSVVSPQTLWLQGPLRPWVEENLKALQSKQLIEKKYFNKAESLLNKPALDNSFFIWQLVNLNLMGFA